MIHLGPRACRELLGEQRFFLSNWDGGRDLDLVVDNPDGQLSFLSDWNGGRNLDLVVGNPDGQLNLDLVHFCGFAIRSSGRGPPAVLRDRFQTAQTQGGPATKKDSSGFRREPGEGNPTRLASPNTALA